MQGLILREERFQGCGVGIEHLLHGFTGNVVYRLSLRPPQSRGEVRVFPVTDEGKTFVLWTSDREGSADGVADFCSPIYQALLGDLKATFAA